ncbi:MAG TPA: hypothetical protein VF331_01900 [Polyangiales bacterium]
MNPTAQFGTVLGCLALCASTGCMTGNGQPAHAGPRGSASGASDASAAQLPDAAAVDGGSPDFELRLLGESIVLSHTGRPTYFWQPSCPTRAVPPSVTKPDNTPLRDDRDALSAQAGYYLDGTFVAGKTTGATTVATYTSWGACDTPATYTCQANDFVMQVLALAREYVTTGTRASGDVTDGGAPVLVPVIETRPFHGKLQVRLGYNVDPDCASQGAVSCVLELEVPEQGVCCPIGPEGCGGSPGPGGGWAASLQACPTWETSSERLWSGPGLRVQRAVDLHGCPILRSPGTPCDSDAGAGG